MSKKKGSKLTVAVIGAIPCLLAVAPTSLASAVRTTADAPTLAVSMFDQISSVLLFPGHWVVASLGMEGIGFGADTLLFIGATSVAYYVAFRILGMLWKSRAVSSSRPENYVIQFDTDPEFVAPNPFRPERGFSRCAARYSQPLKPTAGKC
jgi:hypothetical protein